jgi:hypothetical protein
MHIVLVFDVCELVLKTDEFIGATVGTIVSFHFDNKNYCNCLIDKLISSLRSIGYLVKLFKFLELVLVFSLAIFENRLN